MIIQHNISAINSYRNLGTNQSALSKNLEKLSSGYKINRAGDDAAGLAISESMRSQINGLNQAASNANDAIGLIQTAEGALNEIHSMLQRMTTLSMQAANGTYNSVSRSNIQEEMNTLMQEIDRIANYTDFNGIKPLAANKDEYTLKGDGALVTKTRNAGKMTFQIGPTGAETINVDSQSMTINGILKSVANTIKATQKDERGWEYQTTEARTYVDGKIGTNAIRTVNTTGAIDEKMKANPLYIGANNKSTTFANRSVSFISDAINEVSKYRAKLGAAQNRLEHTINSLKVTSENISAAESRIRDTDMADEITNYTKNNILLQAAQSMLGQANAAPQGVLSLLQ